MGVHAASVVREGRHPREGRQEAGGRGRVPGTCSTTRARTTRRSAWLRSATLAHRTSRLGAALLPAERGPGRSSGCWRAVGVDPRVAQGRGLPPLLSRCLRGRRSRGERPARRGPFPTHALLHDARPVAHPADREVARRVHLVEGPGVRRTELAATMDPPRPSPRSARGRTRGGVAGRAREGRARGSRGHRP